MRHFTSLIVFSLILLCGCVTHEQRFKTGSGDVGEFILQQAAIRGRESITTNGLPAIPGSWLYKEDQYGVIIRFSRGDYDAVERLLRQTFGEPALGPQDNKQGGWMSVYRPTSSSGSIQFRCDSEGSQVIILRHLTEKELSQALRGDGK